MKQNINLGNVVDDGTGDYLRKGGIKINSNFNELYTELGDGSVPHPAGAWQTINSATTTVLNAIFGKSYNINTGTAKVQVKLPKGTSNDYGKVIRIRDSFGSWQANAVTLTPASGDTLKGYAGSETFTTNLTDLELVYCQPGRWEYLQNKQLNKISNGDVATVMRKEFICTAGQTDFLDVFGANDFNLMNTQVYHRGNLLYYGATLSADSDYGSPGETDGTLAPLNGRSIRLRRAAEADDIVTIITYVDGVAQWRSTYNRLDCVILDQTKTNDTTVNGSRLVTDLSTFNTITVEQLGYIQTSNTGLINPDTFEVYVNGVILNEAGTAGTPLFVCSGADADNQSDCELQGGTWKNSNTDYTYMLGSNNDIQSITFDRKFEHGDTITIKWYNNDIGTTLELDDIVHETDKLYIQQGPDFNITGAVRFTDYGFPEQAHIESVPAYTTRVRSPDALFDLIYPIGTIYENAVNPNNPATYMGMGSWKLWGEKRVLFGWTQDNKDTEFGLNNNYLDINGNPTATAGGTGGVRQISIKNDNLPVTQTDEKVLIADDNGTIIVGGCQFDPNDTGPAYDKYREDYADTNKTHTPPVAMETLPPYITVYRWLRIA